MKFLPVNIILLTIIVIQSSTFPIDYYHTPICALLHGGYRTFPSVLALMRTIRKTGNYWYFIKLMSCDTAFGKCTDEKIPVCAYSEALNNFRTFTNDCQMNREIHKTKILWKATFPFACSPIDMEVTTIEPSTIINEMVSEDTATFEETSTHRDGSGGFTDTEVQTSTVMESEKVTAENISVAADSGIGRETTSSKKEEKISNTDALTTTTDIVSFIPITEVLSTTEEAFTSTNTVTSVDTINGISTYEYEEVFTTTSTYNTSSKAKKIWDVEKEIGNQNTDGFTVRAVETSTIMDRFTTTILTDQEEFKTKSIEESTIRVKEIFTIEEEDTLAITEATATVRRKTSASEEEFPTRNFVAFTSTEGGITTVEEEYTNGSAVLENTENTGWYDHIDDAVVMERKTTDGKVKSLEPAASISLEGEIDTTKHNAEIKIYTTEEIYKTTDDHREGETFTTADISSSNEWQRETSTTGTRYTNANTGMFTSTGEELSPTDISSDRGTEIYPSGDGFVTSGSVDANRTEEETFATVIANGTVRAEDEVLHSKMGRSTKSTDPATARKVAKSSATVIGEEMSISNGCNDCIPATKENSTKAYEAVVHYNYNTSNTYSGPYAERDLYYQPVNNHYYLATDPIYASNITLKNSSSLFYGFITLPINSPSIFELMKKFLTNLILQLKNVNNN